MERALFFSCSLYFSLLQPLWSSLSTLQSSQSQLKASWILLHHKARSWGCRCTAAVMGGKIRRGESTKPRWRAPLGIGHPAAACWGHLQPWPWLSPASPPQQQGVGRCVLWHSTKQRARLQPSASPLQLGAWGAACRTRSQCRSLLPADKWDYVIIWHPSMSSWATESLSLAA